MAADTERDRAAGSVGAVRERAEVSQRERVADC